MSYVMFNPNPNGLYVGDCTVRAISKITGQDWDTTYIAIAVNGFMLKDMPSSNHVWGSYLKSRGYHRYVLPDTVETSVVTAMGVAHIVDTVGKNQGIS